MTTLNKRTLSLALVASLVAIATSCAIPGERVDRVQTNLVDKSIFEGEWWYTRTVVALDDDAAWAIGSAGAGAPWVGAMANFDIASDMGSIGRIRWVIDENFLFAYRSHEIVRGASSEADDPEFRGQPLAVFPIHNHVDVRQEYDGFTGQPTNVVSEAEDRRWFDRQYVRVDWSMNLVSFGLFGGGLEIEELFATFHREPVSNFVQEGGDHRTPDSWRPSFVRVGEDTDYRFRDEWPEGTEDTVHYMSFVTNELWTPRNCLGDLCNTSIRISQRHAFLRVPPDHQYAVETLPHQEYDRFGIIRAETRTYVRGGADRDIRRERCASDADCGGAACDVDRNICIGGLIGEYGETDFLTFHRLRHNMHTRSLTDRECVADWECNNRYGDRPASDEQQGSVCDVAARRCTIPQRLRPTRQVTYHLSPQYPRHLVRSAFEVMAPWNESFMVGQRELTNQPLPQPTEARQACQSTDPTQYCFCGDTISAPEVGPDNQCAYRTNFFVAPADRPEVAPFDCWISGPADQATPTSYGDYTDDVYNYRFEGEECLLVLRVNSCDVPVESGPPAACEQMGDIRYQFFNYVSGAGAGWCGVMQPLQDPTTGEAIVSPINMGGLCLERISNNVIDLWPVLTGDASEDVLFSGENVRGYFENLGNVHRPVGVAPALNGGEYNPDPGRPAMPADINAHLNEMFAEIAPRIEPLSAANDGRAQIFSDRLRNLANTSQERRLIDSVAGERLEAPGMASDRFAARRMEDLSPRQLASEVSPFQNNYLSNATAEMRRQELLTPYCMRFEHEALFTARYQRYWAEAFRNSARSEAQIRWQQIFHRYIMQHELGHGLGLEHNFGASYDRNHYDDGYYPLALEYPLPGLDEFDENRDGAITDEEAQAWAAETRRQRTERANRGAGNYMTSSLMDYNGDLSGLPGIGHYDRAAIYYNYFNQAEAFVGDPVYRAGAGTSLDRLLRSDITPRRNWTFYRGGEACDVDNQCPYARGSSALTDGQEIWQRCVRNPRYTNIPTPCGGDTDCICSTFDEDFIDYMEGAGPYESDRDGDGLPDHHYVRYLFCSNNRLQDISWCSVFDAGESFQESIDHFRQVWQEGYPRNYWRNYRRGFFSGSRAVQSIVDATKMFQHLFFRFFFEPEFRRETGPLGFNDQYFASIDAMNWLAEMAQLPQAGSYVFNEDTNSYRFLGEDMDIAGSDLNLLPGQGFYHWSRYQEGLYGFFRMERAGVFWDKLIALQALTIRDWGFSFTIDERYFINFYDLFPVEMTELFGGYIINDDRWMAPRLTVDGDGAPQVSYLNYFRGSCRDAGRGIFLPCRGSNEEVYEAPSIEGTSNEIIRTFATAFALSQFPVFYDTSWERRAIIFKLDNADGFTIPDVQQDGSDTCAYGQAIPGSGHDVCENPEDADYIIYVSERLSTPYVAVKVRPRLTYNLEEEQLGFQLLLRMSERQDRIGQLRALVEGGTATEADRTELRRLRTALQGDESFIEVLTEFNRLFGISSWL